MTHLALIFLTHLADIVSLTHLASLFLTHFSGPTFDTFIVGLTHFAGIDTFSVDFLTHLAALTHLAELTYLAVLQP